MIIFPAIDIIDGGVVRLYRGDYSTAKSYGVSPEDAARAFARAGATHIHAVDLNGAVCGRAVNAPTVARMIEASGAFVEVGGGIRTLDGIRQYLDCGAKRVILGTVAVRDPDLVARAVALYGDAIAVGVDAADGKVAVRGWKEVTDIDSIAFCRKLAEIGVKTVIYTDIARDGTLGGTNLGVYKELVKLGVPNITASGGISEISEITELKNSGVYAAILGKALYENKIDLSEAIAAAKGE